MVHWAKDAIFYHIYPLGFCGAPYKNDFSSIPIARLDKIHGWITHMQYLGVNALYLGPLFEASTHGYNTADYFQIDRRLGTHETLVHLTGELHQRRIRVVLDGVFNHVGRDFWAFKDVQAHGNQSPYRDWFYNLRFDHSSPHGDAFSYEGWNGHYSLVKLNLQNPAVKAHLFAAVKKWILDFGIDGLRLDAADCIDHQFLKELSVFCHAQKPDFWLMGEVVHGDYRQWANPDELDSVTNYECYKGLHSSHNEQNFFEIAYSLNRQFGEGGIYRSLDLYTFADNHDVNRIASILKNPAQLIPLYILLYAMPGIPSIYYGSEFGIAGRKEGGDAALRPCLNLDSLNAHNHHRDLTQLLHRLAALRQRCAALRSGDYRQVYVDQQLIAFIRQAGEEWVLVMINASEKEVQLSLPIPASSSSSLVDIFNNDEQVQAQPGQVHLVIPPYWARVIRPAG